MQHNQSISQSFGPQANAYLTSPIHSQGADLRHLSDLVGATGYPVVLDLGCGAGHASFALAPCAQEVVAYDLTESMLQVVASTAAKRQLPNIHTQQGSVDRLSFSDSQFDWAVSRYSAHHWRDVPQALREVRRVLKPGGQICFIDAAGGPEPLFDTHLQALELLRDPSHVRDYTEQEWLSLFQSACFQAKVIRRWRVFVEFSSWVSRIGTPEDRVTALRSLWSGAPAEVRTYFNLQNDLSFEIDVIMIQAHINDL
jgi:ubiquinone/menaquinone biosynthesis C-methylase UbiE